MIMVSSQTLERSDAPAVMNYINQLREGTNLLNEEE
jgi:hypothetical protein